MPKQKRVTDLFTGLFSGFIFRIACGTYQHGQQYQQRAAYLYKKDGMKNKPQSVSPCLIQSR